MPTAAELVTDAKGRVDNLDPDRFAAATADEGAVLIDLREPTELESSGVIPGAVHAPRGMLEFWADPTSPYHRDEFDPTRRTLLYCGSGARSALAADTLQRLGYRDVAHLDGGIKAWQEAGHPTVALTDA